MNSRLYRCGWCGCPTDSKGHNLSGDTFDRVVNIVKQYGDSHTTQTHGDCCLDEKAGPQMIQVTRDMALDAGDPDLEGTWIQW